MRYSYIPIILSYIGQFSSPRLTIRDLQINKYPAKALDMLLRLPSTLVSLLNQ